MGIFVELIHSLGNYYLYDVNTNGIYEISKRLYCLIKNNANRRVEELLELADDTTKNEIIFLINQGCLSNNRPEIIEHTANNYIKSLLTQYLSNMLLQVTKQCNFKCRYCAFAGETNLERNHSNQYMDWITAKKAVDFLFQNSKFSRKITIGFYGGEPLLNYDLIKKVINYADKLFAGRNLTYVMTTNLSVLTEDMIDVFNNHDFRIAVSLDGSEELHDKNRRFFSNGKGTHNLVVKNLAKLKKSMKDFNTKISINAVTDPEENYYSYVEYFNNEELFSGLDIEYERIDTSRLKYDLIENPEYKIEFNVTKLRNYLKLICEKSIDWKKTNIVTSEIASSYYYFMLKKRLNKKEHHRGPCVPGVRKLFVSSEGNFLPCEKVSEESVNMIIGNVNTGFVYKKIYDLLNIGKLTEDDCKNCTCIRHCSICAKEIDNIINLDANIKKTLCKDKRSYLKEQIEKYVIFKQIGLFDYIQ